MREITLAVVQMQPKLAETEANLARMVRLIEEIGSTEKIDLIIFPELCITGYECGVRFTELAETVPGHVTNVIGKKAQSTYGPEVLSGVGFFGSLFEMKGYKQPVIVSSTDSVGTKVKIAIETVWNNFITKPEQLIQFVDDLKSPSAAAYFDCSNMLKYMVPSATWIRKLGKRMVKFDFKGYSHKSSWCPIGEGDEDWPEVLKALAEVGYDGWATAEVGGGDEKVLLDISRRMDKVLGLA